MIYSAKRLVDQNLQCFDLSSNAIHLWYVDIRAITPSFYLSLSSSLSSDEKDRADNFKFEKDRYIYIIARGILRQLLAVYTKNVPSNIKFGYNPYGKPFLISSSTTRNIQFNVSHSENLISYAVTLEYPIGIDVELVQAKFFDDGMVQQILSTREQVRFNKLPKDKQLFEFYRLWVCKESLLKALGYGFSHSPLEAEFSLTQNHASLIRLGRNYATSQEWIIKEFCPLQGYIGAVSFKTSRHKNFNYSWVTEGLFLKTIHFMQ